MEDQKETSDSNILCKEQTGVLCVWKPFSSKIKLLFVLEQKTWIKYQTFFFFLFPFVQQLPTRLRGIFLPQFSFIDIKASCPLHLWLFHIPLIILPVQPAEQQQITKQRKIRLDFRLGKMQPCAASPAFFPLFPPPSRICFHP